eukprot:1485481-Amphidinium_carterae.1
MTGAASEPTLETSQELKRSGPPIARPKRVLPMPQLVSRSARTVGVGTSLEAPLPDDLPPSGEPRENAIGSTSDGLKWNDCNAISLASKTAPGRSMHCSLRLALRIRSCISFASPEGPL